MPASLKHVLAITSLVQCLVTAISREIDQGTFQSDYHPMMVQQNKWRATRFGADAELVSTIDYQQQSVATVTNSLVDRLLPIAEELGCEAELESLRSVPQNAGAKQQLQLFSETDCRTEVVRRMIASNHWNSD